MPESKYYRPKDTPKRVFILIIILISIPITVYLANNIVKYFSRADEEPVSPANIVLLSNLTDLSEGESAKIIIKVDTYIDKATFLRISVVFDQTKINLINQIDTEPGWWIVQKTTLEEANSTGNILIVLAYPPNAEPPSLTYNVASFEINPITNNPTTTALGFNNLDMQVVYETVSPPNITTAGQTISLNPCIGCVDGIDSDSIECIPYDQQSDLLCGADGVVCAPCAREQICVEGVCVSATSPTPTLTPASTPTPTLTPTPTIIPTPTLSPTPTPTPRPRGRSSYQNLHQTSYTASLNIHERILTRSI